MTAAARTTSNVAPLRRFLDVCQHGPFFLCFLRTAFARPRRVQRLLRSRVIFWSTGRPRSYGASAEFWSERRAMLHHAVCSCASSTSHQHKGITNKCGRMKWGSYLCKRLSLQSLCSIRSANSWCEIRWSSPPWYETICPNWARPTSTNSSLNTYRSPGTACAASNSFDT